MKWKVLAVLPILIGAYFIYLNRQAIKKCLLANKKYEEQNGFLKQHIQGRDMFWYFSSENEIVFQNNESVNLNALFKRKKLVLRYPQKACDCFDDILFSLKNSPIDLHSDFLVLITTDKYRQYRSLFF